MKLRKLIGIFCIFYILLGLSATTASATETSNSEDAPDRGFTFEVIYPENQHNKEAAYFDLRMAPSQQQTVIIRMNNTSDEEMTMNVSLNSAKTNNNGVVEYGPVNIENDASLQYDFTDIVTGAESITIPARSSVDYPIEINMPDATFEGYISGGIQMMQQDDGESDEAQGMVVNKYAYMVGMLLSVQDSDHLKPDLKFNRVYPELRNYHNTIFVNFSNTQPVYMDEMTIDVQIMNQNSDAVLYDTKQTKMRMAPNSMINFPVSMNGEQMVPGEYRAAILVTNALNGDKWEWEENFTITDEEADKFNQEDVGLIQEQGIDWTIIIWIVGGIILLIVIIFLIVRSINKKKAETKRKRKKTAKKKM